MLGKLIGLEAWDRGGCRRRNRRNRIPQTVRAKLRSMKCERYERTYVETIHFDGSIDSEENDLYML